VLVTGHSGFIGSWLALALQQLGARVSGLALPPPTDPAHFVAARVGEGMTHHVGDVRRAEVVDAILAEAKPEIVFHLAAQPLVRTAWVDPLTTFGTNVMGTLNVLDAVRRSPHPRAVAVYTTDKVYANREWPWPYREIDALGGSEPYGASKAAAEHVVEAYRRTYFADPARPVGLAALRAGNVIGGGDWAADRLVPDAVRAFAAGDSLLIRHPSAVRPWQHVLEPVGATLLLARLLLEKPDLAAQAWNIGPDDGEARPVSWVADRLVTLWPGAKPWHSSEQQGPYEANHLTLDNSKAHFELGWRPGWTLERALQQTVAWYHAFYRGDDAAALSRRQIGEYFDEP
jgi:CDP-glucose 4,6-dehydratase